MVVTVACLLRLGVLLDHPDNIVCSYKFWDGENPRPGRVPVWIKGRGIHTTIAWGNCRIQKKLSLIKYYSLSWLTTVVFCVKRVIGWLPYPTGYCNNLRSGSSHWVSLRVAGDRVNPKRNHEWWIGRVTSFDCSMTRQKEGNNGGLATDDGL